MKKFNLALLLLACLFALATTAWSQEMTQGGDIEKLIAGLEEQWVQAELANNADLSAPLFAEKAVFTGVDGTVRDKAAFVAEEKASKYETAEVIGLKVTAFGDTAIATYVFKGNGSNSGKAFALNQQATDTWVKMPDGKWQLVASHSSLIKK